MIEYMFHHGLSHQSFCYPKTLTTQNFLKYKNVIHKAFFENFNMNTIGLANHKHNKSAK